MGCDSQFDGLYESKPTPIKVKVPKKVDQLERIANALERIADVLEESQTNHGRIAVQVEGVIAAG